MRYSAVLADDRPSSLLECRRPDGSLDIMKLRLRNQKLDDLEALQAMGFRPLATIEDTAKPAKKRMRSCKTDKLHYFDDDGVLHESDPMNSWWYLSYYKRPMLSDKKWRSKFRLRFRMPYPQFIQLLKRLENSLQFLRWRSRDATGTQASPLPLLLLGALRYLGRGLTFDDIEDMTHIAQETHRQFFHEFILFGKEVLYPEYVRTPKTTAEIRRHMPEFDEACMPGACCSMDATNVILWNCTHNLKQYNTGFKGSHPARTYNICVNHRREILHSTTGHPARWNDKTLAWFDSFARGIHSGELFFDHEFVLLSRQLEAGRPVGNVIETRYRGSWIVVDNGYHKWACTQAPLKSAETHAASRWSKWLESMRKDVECTFGILKGRWRILQTGVRLHGVEAADAIWLTCCALHNMLLHVDGLSERWMEGHKSDWEGEMGRNDAGEMHKWGPVALQRIQSEQFLQSFGSREHELSVQQVRIDDENISGELDRGTSNSTTDGSIAVNSLSYEEFQHRLIQHFDIKFDRQEIVWPSRKRSS